MGPVSGKDEQGAGGPGSGLPLTYSGLIVQLPYFNLSIGKNELVGRIITNSVQPTSCFIKQLPFHCASGASLLQSLNSVIGFGNVLWKPYLRRLTWKRN